MRVLNLRTAVAGIMLLAPAAWAGIFPANDRPLPMLPNDSTDALPSGMPATGPTGTNLQDILNYIYKCTGCVDAKEDQSDASMWTPSTNPGVLAPALVVEFSSSQNFEFGIWSGNDASSLTRAPLFKPAAVGLPATFTSKALLEWDETGTQMMVSGANTAVYNDIYSIPMSAFGFYIKNATNTWFTDDELNGGSPQALVYLGANSSTSAGAWTIAFEDHVFASSDKDFNDFVVKIESMAAVPEPASVLLLGTTLLGFGLFMRTRRVQ